MIKPENLRKKLGCRLPQVLLAGILSSYMTVAAPMDIEASTLMSGGLNERNSVVVSQSAQSVSLPVAFDPESKWDWIGENFDFTMTTDEIPQEGIMLTVDLLVQASAQPQFQGRMNVAAIMLIGEEKRWAQCAVPTQVRAINFTQPVIQDDVAWYRSKVVMIFSGTVDTDVNGKWTKGIPYRQVINQPVTGMKVYIAGTQCDYKGMLRLENPKLGYTEEMDDGVSVNTTVPRHDLTAVSVQKNVLVLENGSRQVFPQVTLVDSKASADTVSTARYLAALGKTDHIIFGHQNSAWSKAGTVMSPLNGLTNSDIEDITDSPAGIIGFDGLSLVGEEFSSALWNNKFAQQGMKSIDIAALGETAANVKALAQLTENCLNSGALVTMSCHMPNFAQVKVQTDYEAGKEPSYARYDFTMSSARDKSGSPMQDILPGGSCNVQFTAYLDMVADYASQINGAILFRPFHEGNGTWFWWGTSSCDAETYQKVFRYTVEYLRDRKQVHNLIYVYSPAAGPEFMDEMIKRYPGDDYVDMIGYDNYQNESETDSVRWFEDFSAGLSEIGKFATQHSKLFAVTETGINASIPAPGDVVTGLPRQGCSDLRWFEKLLDAVSDSDACYVLLWANGSEMFHTPFVRAANGDGSLYGHELLDDFIRFYNDRRSVFAVNQVKIVRSFQ